MTTKPEDFLLQACKRQAESGLRLLEAAVEGSIRLAEAQLEAAAEAHADLEATRKAIAAATDLQEIWKLQSEWAQGSLRRSLAYWRASGGAWMPLPGMHFDAPRETMLGLVDSAYKQWLEAAQRFYPSLDRVAA
jgi:hypothetical protein